MKIYAHRVNSIAELNHTPDKLGVEIDLRSKKNKLILSHDPFSENYEYFEDWLACYRHNGIIINLKEDGLQDQILDVLKSHKISQFFFLDLTGPTIYKLLKKSESRIAIRLSEFEPIFTISDFRVKPEYIWVDFFSNSWKHLLDIEESPHKICIASPELHDINRKEYIPQLRDYLNTNSIKIDSVCTKFPELWLS